MRRLGWWQAMATGACCALGLAMAASSGSAEPPREKHTAPHKSAANKSPGQRAFEQNCSRCHQAPEQLRPRITGTVLMHMRTRANLSEADEKELLRFLAP